MLPIPRSSGALLLRCLASLPNSNLHFRLSLPPTSFNKEVLCVSGKKCGYRSFCNRWCTTSRIFAHRLAIATLIRLRFALRLCMVERTIKASPAKCCELDPAPTFLVKDCLDILSPFLTLMCNASIQEGILPAS